MRFLLFDAQTQQATLRLRKMQFAGCKNTERLSESTGLFVVCLATKNPLNTKLGTKWVEICISCLFSFISFYHFCL